MEKRIVHKESISSGKFKGKNDDDIYIGDDYAAVIDGVSHKSQIQTEDGEIKIAQIITKAIKKIDGTNYAKDLNFDEFVKYINWYIAEYLIRCGYQDYIGKMEATGVVYSKQFNQIWLVGDCRAIYDGHVVKNPLKVDSVYVDIRIQIVKALIQEGYSMQFLEEHDVSKEIIHNPEAISKYISNPNTKNEIEEYRINRIKAALLECGFTEQEIETEDLIRKYYNPRDLQAVVKNNPNMGEYGYAIFNGQYTEQRNCKVVTLPDNVKTIKLFSDGFSINALNNDRDIGYAVREEWKKANIDPLSININKATHPAQKYGRGSKQRAIDDASAVILEIKPKERKIDEGR